MLFPIITERTNGVKQTSCLRNDIKDFTYKNPQRCTYIEGNGLSVEERTAIYVGVNPILGYSRGIVAKDSCLKILSYISNTQGAFLAAREVLYLCKEGKLMSYVPKGYKASNILEEWTEGGILKGYSEYSKKDAIAREAKLKSPEKGLSNKVISFILNVIEKETHVLLEEGWDTFLIQNISNRQLTNYPQLTERQNSIAQGAMDLMQCVEKDKDPYLLYLKAITFYKSYIATQGITVDLLYTMIEETLPGKQAKRKEKILAHLINHFNLLSSTPKLIKPLNPHSGLLTVPPSPHHETSERMVKKEEVKKQEVKKQEVKLEREVEKKKSIKEIAADSLVEQVKPELEGLNNKIRKNLLNHKDKDAIDTRQRARMLNDISPIPLSYNPKSVVSPRIYSEVSDNLFSCRKSMRMQALKGLGAVDVDLKSCHTYILLAYWGDRLPLLKQAMEKGTLWDLYKTHYESLNYPFHKKAVKAIHYASVLGGGKNAFLQAIHRHNLDNPLEAITNPEELIKAHKKSPIYKELKALLSYIQKQWEGKIITLQTGEEFKVKGYRKYKDKKTGKVVTQPGNLLTTLSAFLQSKEVLLMSYLILNTKGLYTPLLWQHDGLTIIPKRVDYLEKMQSIMNKGCSKLLPNNIFITLEVTNMPDDVEDI